jgi:hypothetical protein
MFAELVFAAPMKEPSFARRTAEGGCPHMIKDIAVLT